MSDKYVKYIVGVANGFNSSFIKTDYPTLEAAIAEYADTICYATKNRTITNVFLNGVLTDGTNECINAIELGLD